ncbi:MAG: FAD-dependent oxidoreductase [Pseudonocardiaceae bacterium]
MVGDVIRLSYAWRAASAGFTVTLHDPASSSGASRVAGGMLAPVTEAVPGEEAALAMGVAALRRWPDFAAELTTAGADPGLMTGGTLAVAVDPGDRAELDRLAEQLARMGQQVEALDGRAARRAEPALGPQVRRPLSVPGDLSVDNRALLDALLVAARRAGVRFCLRRCEQLPQADAVVLAAGAHSAALHPALHEVIRPVKGEILRLRARAGPWRRRPGRSARSWAGAGCTWRPGRAGGWCSERPSGRPFRHRRHRRFGYSNCSSTPTACCPRSQSTPWRSQRRGCARAARTTCPCSASSSPA